MVTVSVIEITVWTTSEHRANALKTLATIYVFYLTKTISNIETKNYSLGHSTVDNISYLSIELPLLSMFQRPLGSV